MSEQTQTQEPIEITVDIQEHENPRLYATLLHSGLVNRLNSLRAAQKCNFYSPSQVHQKWVGDARGSLDSYLRERAPQNEVVAYQKLLELVYAGLGSEKDSREVILNLRLNRAKKEDAVAA